MAGNPSAPPEALARLARDRAPAVRRIVANHAGLPAASLAAFTNDRNEFVRETASGVLRSEGT